MTGWLSGWLRDIILIILLASFVDLLIPNNSLQRYIKVVVSLIILLTILSPIIALINKDFATESVLRQAAAPSAASGLPELPVILKDGERLRQEREQQTLALVAAEIERHVAAETERQFPVRVVSASVRLTARTHDEEPELSAIELVLAQTDTPEPDDEQSRKAVSPVAVESVGTVTQVDIAVSSSTAQFGDEQSPHPPDDQQRRELARSIARSIAKYWEVSEQRVDIVWHA